MILTYKYRLKPSHAQRTALTKIVDLCRWTYNETLASRKTAYEDSGKTLSLFDTNKFLPVWKLSKPELKLVHSQVLQNTQLRVDLAFKGFFRRVRHGEKPGFPRFRGQDRYDSFTCPQYGNGVNVSDGALILSKVGRVKMVEHRPLPDGVRTVTIQRNNLGNWYACFTCEVEPVKLPVSDEMVGVDLGLTTFATLSNGEVIKRERWMKNDEKDIARLQRQKESLPKGSPERKKSLRRLQHAHKRVANRRNNFAHQASRTLVNRYGLLAFEKLDIKSMLENGYANLHRGISDVAWGRFVEFCAYKAECAGRAMILVDARGTTQECSSCGKTVKKELSERTHNCPHCGLVMDRDLNAALNILGRGLASLEPADLGS